MTEELTDLQKALDFEPRIPSRRLALWLTARWREKLPGWAISGVAGQTEWRALIVASLVPLLLDLALRTVGAGSRWQAELWMVIYSSLISGMLITAPWAWDRVVDLARPIDTLFPAADAEYQAYAARAHRRLRVGREQYVLCVLGALVAMASTRRAGGDLPTDMFGPMFYVEVAALGFVGADSLSWVFRVPLILVQPLTSITRLRVVLHSPATTAGIREMAEVAADTALRAGIGLFVLGLALLWQVLTGVPYSGHGISHTGRLALISLGPLVLSTIAVVYVTFVPQMWLSEIVATQRDRILDQLAESLPSEDPTELTSDEAERKMKVYDTIAAAATDTGEARVIARRLLAVVAVLLPQILASGAKLLGLA